MTDVKASYVSDPMLFMPDGTYGSWYAFFEVKNSDPNLTHHQGQIGCAISENQVCNNTNYVVLNQPAS